MRFKVPALRGREVVAHCIGRPSPILLGIDTLQSCAVVIDFGVGGVYTGEGNAVPVKQLSQGLLGVPSSSCRRACVWREFGS